MKTIKEFKSLLFANGKTTFLGMALNTLFNEEYTHSPIIQNLDEKIEVIVQMHDNGINAFTDNYKLGNVSKAYYQVQLKKYKDFK